MMSGGTLFEELGYYYVGPVDGHDMDNLVPILENIRDKKDDKPVSHQLPVQTLNLEFNRSCRRVVN